MLLMCVCMCCMRVPLMFPQISVGAAAAVATTSKCCVVGCTHSAPRNITVSYRTALQSLSLTLDDSNRICKKHVLAAQRQLSSDAAVAAVAAAEMCCYCGDYIIKERPYRPIIDGVKRAAHGRCAEREKRIAHTAAVGAASDAAALVAAAAAAEATHRRCQALRSSGECARITAVQPLYRHRETLIL